VEWEGRIIRRINASYIEFDAEGVRDVRASAATAVHWYEAAELESRVRSMEVPDLPTARKARNLRKQVTWQLSEQDFALIVGDTIKSPRRPIPILLFLRDDVESALHSRRTCASRRPRLPSCDYDGAFAPRVRIRPAD
jgi:hypothetical protein